MTLQYTRGKARFGDIEFSGDSTSTNAGGHPLRTHVIEIVADATGSEQDTGFDLPADWVVTNVYVRTTTAESTGSTKTIDVGLLSSESGGDLDGFLDGVDVSAVGIKVPELATAGMTRGALLRETATGTVPKHHPATAVTAKSLVYKSGSAFSEWRGKIAIEYFQI